MKRSIAETFVENKSFYKQIFPSKFYSNSYVCIWVDVYFELSKNHFLLFIIPLYSLHFTIYRLKSIHFTRVNESTHLNSIANVLYRF